MFETNLQKSINGDKIEKTSEKPYVCSYCGKKFRQSGTAKVHERIHTGDKPYACKTCNYKSTTNGNLKLHEKTHLKEKIEKIIEPVRAVIFNSDFTDNPCAKCEEKFDDLVDLAVHFNKKHERVNKQLKCPVCPKMLYSISVLKNHVNVTHLKRYQSQKKRPPKTIGTVICKIRLCALFLALNIDFKIINRLQYQVAEQLLKLLKRIFILIISKPLVEYNCGSQFVYRYLKN